MTAKRILLILGGAAALALAVSLLVPGISRGANPVLNATVGGGTDGNSYIISLKDANGNTVTQLDPGTYDIHVTDLATIHNFDLFGPGVEKATAVELVQNPTWTVTFTNGLYTYQCDVHRSQMHGTFRVGTPPPKPTVLKGSVGPGHTISLKKGSANVKSLKAGKYTVKVRDRSAKLNFHLKGPGVSKKTSVSFKGTKTWKVRLKAGKYVYRSDVGNRLKKSFKVH
jgi:plastocyanin